MLDLYNMNREKIKNLQTFGFNNFLGKSQFEDNGMQNYSVSQPVFKYSKTP